MRKSQIVFVCLLIVLTSSMNLSEYYERSSLDEECKEGHFKVKDCTDCPNPHCKVCNQDEPTKCEECFNIIEKNRKTSKNCNCPDGYVQVDVVGTSKINQPDIFHSCYKCEEYLCAQCHKDKTDCTVCSHETRDITKVDEVTNLKCQCKDGFYQYTDKDGNKQKECKPCPCGCVKCTQKENGSEQVECQGCHGQRKPAENYAHVCQCPDRTFDPYQGMTYSECRAKDKYAEDCQNCDEKCQKCDNGKDCLECRVGTNRDPIKICPCKPGFAEGDQYPQCVECTPFKEACESCTDPKCCDTCNSKNNFIKDGNCGCKCKDTFYLENKECKPCVAPCDKCSSKDNCETCIDNLKEKGYVYDKESKKCHCPEGYFDDEQKGCSKCLLHCKICKSKDICDECYSSETGKGYPPRQVTQCNCPSSYYSDICGKEVGVWDNKEENSQCQWCLNVCEECKCEALCTKCRSNRIEYTQQENFKDKHCEGNCCCPVGEYDVFANPNTGTQSTSCGVCKKCPTAYHCLDCTQKPNQNPKCISCRNDNWELKEYGQPYFNTQCICKNGYYLENEECKKCHVHCLTCNGGSHFDCLTCQEAPIVNCPESQPCKQIRKKEYYDADSNKCVCLDTEGQYIDYSSDECFQCKVYDERCLKCEFDKTLQKTTPQDKPNNYNHFKCTQCVENYGPNAQFVCECKTKCTDCEFPCLLCDGTNKKDCTDCRGNRQKVPLGEGELSTNCKCPDGTYHDNSKDQCPPCSPKCKTCKGPDSCETCKNGQEILITDPDTKIIKNTNPECKCPLGKYPFINDQKQETCPDCDFTCDECNGPDNRPCEKCAQKCTFQTEEFDVDTGNFKKFDYTVKENCYKQYESQPVIDKQNCICNRELVQITGDISTITGYITDSDKPARTCQKCPRFCANCQYFPWDPVRKSCNCRKLAYFIDETFINKVLNDESYRKELQLTQTVDVLQKYFDQIKRDNLINQCNCQPGFTPTTDLECKACKNPDVCDHCVPHNESVCCDQHSCKATRVAVPVPNTKNCFDCICDAANGYVENSKETPCPKCSWRCERCIDTITNCTVCKHDTRINPSTGCLCDLTNSQGNGWFYEIDQVNECKQCPKKCTCCKWDGQEAKCDFDKDKNDCCATVNGVTRINSPDCVCPDGFFDDPTKNDGSCTPCSAPCEKCKNSSDNCISCPTNAHLAPLENGKQTCVCDDNYYQDKSDPYCCDPCPHQCKTCFKEGENLVCGGGQDSCRGNRKYNQDTKLCECEKGTYEDYKSTDCQRLNDNQLKLLLAQLKVQESTTPTMKKLNNN